MTRTVWLGMYDPGHGAIDRLWRHLRGRFIAAGFKDLPESLDDVDIPETAWLAPDLFLAHTCGYPLRTSLAGRVRYVGTPVYAVEGTEGPYYRSALVVRADDAAQSIADLRGRRAAFNATHSQSGYNSFREVVSPFAEGGRFFAETVATGSHAASLEAVAAGRADVAAIDPVTFELQPEGVRASVKRVGWTSSAPGLPLITGLGTSDVDLVSIRAVLSGFFADAHERHPQFRFAGFSVLPDEAYDSIPAMEQRAIDRSYPHLA
jgi:ABC-type phosphate/phosphonate transport system substrate-binding protein